MPARARPLLKMSQQPEDYSPAEAELLVLRAIIQGTPQGPVRDTALRLLEDYHWDEPLHQAIFNCLRRFSSADANFLRGELPACLTRQGFPDVDWAGFLAPHSLTKREVEQALSRLLQTD
jgi:hypothetical protein